MNPTDPTAARILAAEVLRRAVEDMKGNGLSASGGYLEPTAIRDRIGAIAWLASSRATIYFDLMGIEQSRALVASRWPKYARAILRGGRIRTPRPYKGTRERPEPVPLSRGERRVIQAGLAALEGLGEEDAA